MSNTPEQRIRELRSMKQKHGLTNREIAAQMEISEWTVMRWLDLSRLSRMKLDALERGFAAAIRKREKENKRDHRRR